MGRYTGIDGIPDLVFPGLDKRSPFLYVCWQEFCHVLGSLLLIALSHLALVYTSYDAPRAVFILLALWMTFQEFYLHPKKYGQPLWKGILDWLSWVLPFLVYFALF